MRNKIKCGLRRAHLGIWAKMCLRGKGEREARVLEIVGDWCKSFHLFKILQEGRRKKARASSAKGLRYEPKPYKVIFDVWARKTLIHPWVFLMVGLG